MNGDLRALKTKNNRSPSYSPYLHSLCMYWLGNCYNWNYGYSGGHGYDSNGSYYRWYNDGFGSDHGYDFERQLLALEQRRVLTNQPAGVAVQCLPPNFPTYLCLTLNTCKNAKKHPRLASQCSLPRKSCSSSATRWI
jgi:hypothetical protein